MPLVAAEGKATPSTTEECKYIVDKHPDRFILFCNVDPRDLEYTARFVDEFSDRILFDCDFTTTKNTHPFALAATLDKLLDDGMISPENYKKIVRDNAVKLLNL